jgi:hypothetical protein
LGRPKQLYKLDQANSRQSEPVSNAPQLLLIYIKMRRANEEMLG